MPAVRIDNCLCLYTFDPVTCIYRPVHFFHTSTSLYFYLNTDVFSCPLCANAWNVCWWHENLVQLSCPEDAVKLSNVQHGKTIFHFICIIRCCACFASESLMRCIRAAHHVKCLQNCRILRVRWQLHTVPTPPRCELVPYEWNVHD